MIKIYNTNHDFLKMLSYCYNGYTVETLNDGLKTLYFQVPCKEEYLALIQEENYVETEDYSFIIKEIIMEDNDFFGVYCRPNIEDLTGKYFVAFDVLEKSLQAAYVYCLSLTDWKIDYQSTNLSIVTYQAPRVTGYEMIELLASDYGQELWFDTKNKTLKVFDKMGKDFGAYYSNELKLKQLIKQSSSYDYFTVLHPIGKNGLTIKLVNNNKDFLEDYSYSNKFIEKYLIEEDIEAPELLLKKAQKYLAENCYPKTSYKLSLSDLGEQVQLGDSIQIVDKIKQIKQKQRVVKIIRYFNEPEKDSVEISNLQANFARAFVNQQKNIKKELTKIKKQLADLTRN